MTFSLFKMTDTRSLLWRALLNVVVVIVIASPVLFLYIYGKPTVRGFFCNDESIRHPFISSTVPAPPMYVVGFVLPVVVVAVVEFSGRRTLPQEGSIVWGRFTIPPYAVSIFFLYIGYLFGTAVTQCLTDVTKYWVGRLRPHFIAVCNPDFNLIECGTDTNPIYVTKYMCRGNGQAFGANEAEVEHRIRESRISFVSGHSSFSFQIAIFLILYLQARGLAVFNRSKHFLVIPLLQFTFVTAALLTAISRVMDYKHHPGDVIAGGLLGTVVQFLNVVFIMKLFKKFAHLPESLDEESVDVRNTELVEDGHRNPNQLGDNLSAANYYFSDERSHSGNPHTPHN